MARTLALQRVPASTIDNIRADIAIGTVLPLGLPDTGIVAVPLPVNVTVSLFSLPVRAARDNGCEKGDDEVLGEHCDG